MMAIDIYLTFNGNCREVVETYASIFEANNMEMKTFGEMEPNPDYPLPEVAKELILHARLTINGTTIMFSDTFPGTPYEVGNNISLTYVSSDMAEIKRLFQQLKEGGKVDMELQETFWSKCYGKLTDKFGIHWQFSHED